MNVYERAKRHAWLVTKVFVALPFFGLLSHWLFDQGHPAFVTGAIFLMLLNLRHFAYCCPNCGSNLFYRGIIAMPWPNRTCSKCGTVLDTSGNCA